MNPNIVLITIDSLRADRCGHLNQNSELTPTIDQMAANGISFENAVAPGPKTPESMPAIFTGQYPTAHQADSELDSWQEAIESHMVKRESFPEYLSNKGYETIAFTPNGFTSRYFGFDQGFDFFEDFLDNDIRPGFGIPNHLRGLIKFVRREGNWKRWEGYYDDIITQVRNASEPYFLWVFLLDVHSPYLTPRAYRRENSWFEMMYANWRAHNANESDTIHDSLVSAYEDTVSYVDDFINYLRADLDDTNPVYLVHSDHGEAFGEHGIYGHERYLYEENLRVPFLIAGVPIQANIGRPMSLRSFPEIIRRITTGDTAALLRQYDETTNTRPIVSHSAEGKRTTVRMGWYKYIASRNESGELYDLESDPSEQEDLSDELTGIREVMSGHIRAFRDNIQEKATLQSKVSAIDVGVI